jgi:hypothetical protein
MLKRDSQREKIRELLQKKKVYSLSEIAICLGTGERMAQLYLKDLQSLTSYTHRGQFITLPDIPRFDEHGIWSYRHASFSRFGNSLDTIIGLVEQSKSGFSREELEAILKIGISKQIQILVQREKLQRIKLGNKYLYIPEGLSQNKKRMLILVGDRQVEEYFEKDIQKTDLIALLKAVLIEKKIKIDAKSLKRFTQKYSLRIPVKKVEQLLLKYDLQEKKTPLN